MEDLNRNEKLHILPTYLWPPLLDLMLSMTNPCQKNQKVETTNPIIEKSSKESNEPPDNFLKPKA